MTRWTPLRKKRVVDLCNAGRTQDVGKILADNQISAEEFGTWLARFHTFGIHGLSVKRIQAMSP
jgi:Protein of unknown function (DUF1153)